MPGFPGFTRIDLVSVFAGLALVFIAIVPALARGRVDAERSVCANNLTQVLAAVALYAKDNNDEMPYPSWGTVPLDNWCFARTLTNGLRFPSAAGRWGPDAHTNQLPFYFGGQLAPFLDSQRTLVCPTDWIEAMGSKLGLYQVREIKLTSYGLNGAVIGFGTRQTTYKLSQFKPTDIIFWEESELIPFLYNDPAAKPNELPSLRHESGHPTGVIDGSTEFITPRDFVELSGGPLSGTHRRPTVLPNRLWCQPGSRTGGY